MQPYIFPSMSHFSLIAHSDFWIVFDVTQYTPKSWITRNRLSTQSQGDILFSVNLERSSRSQKIHELRIADAKSFRDQIIGKLSAYRRYAANYKTVVEVVDEVFGRLSSDSLVELNALSLSVTCEYLGLQFEYEIASRLDFDHGLCKGAGMWAPVIAAHIGASEYLNPIGGSALFDNRDFSGRGIQLLFLEWSEFKYTTFKLTYQPNLSILDAMMWCTPMEIKDALVSYGKIVRGEDVGSPS